MIAYAKNIMKVKLDLEIFFLLIFVFVKKNIQPNENRRNNAPNSSSDFSILDQRHQ